MNLAFDKCDILEDHLAGLVQIVIVIPEDRLVVPVRQGVPGWNVH